MWEGGLGLQYLSVSRLEAYLLSGAGRREHLTIHTKLGKGTLELSHVSGIVGVELGLDGIVLSGKREQKSVHKYC